MATSPTKDLASSPLGLLGQGTEADPAQGDGACPDGALEAGELGASVRAAGGQYQEGPVGGQGGKLGGEVQRGGVGPVQVLQGQHGGAYADQARDQRAQRREGGPLELLGAEAHQACSPCQR